MGPRVLSVLAVGLCLAVPALPAAPASAAPAVPRPTASTTGPDFDGDGRYDLASAVLPDAGRSGLNVRYGSGATRPPLDEISDGDQTLVQQVVAADLNSDGYTDLAFVTYTPPSVEQLHLVFGSASGLTTGSMYTVSTPFLSADQALGGLAFLDSPTPRLAVGVLDEDPGVGGAVALYDLGSDGRPVGDPTFLSAGSAGVPALWDADSFGSILAASGNHLFVGMPGEKVHGHRGAGAVVALDIDAAGRVSGRLLTQDSRGVGGVARSGDGFGSSLAALDGYLAVGVPDDQVGRVRDAGSVNVFTISATGLEPLRRISQSTPGVPGGSERGDRFGSAVALGAVCAGVEGVVVGGPGEDIGRRHRDAGAAWLVPLVRTPGCAARQLYEGHGLPGRPTSGRGLGTVVGTVRDAGAASDDAVLGAFGGSDGEPDGLLDVWSPASRSTVLSVSQATRGFAGR